jgi:hypothetical protein
VPVKSLPQGTEDESTVRKELRQAISDTKYLEQQWDNLLKGHRDEWVGVFRKQTLFAPALEQLLEKANQEGWDLGLMVIDRLVEERPAALL